jgi:2-keto-4-pentenoate hydratase/2-oxohepta-3-ene-1,7-dioic acid hydratase in catechol pathway
MRLALFSEVSGRRDGLKNVRHGLVTNAGVFDIGRISGSDLTTLLGSPEKRAGVEAACLGKPDYAASEVHMLPPILADAKIVCVGLNFHGHLLETGRDPTARPTLFLRLADSHVGHGEPLVCPHVSEKFDFEGEIAIVIGKPGRHIQVETAMEHVGGYTCYNDASARDWQRHSSQFTPGKNFFASGSIGPWIVTADEVTDPNDLAVTTRLNGLVVQEGKLSQLIFNIPYLISYISTFTPLRTGDIIATGTPEGVGMGRTPPLWMVPGDQVEVEVSGVGCLRNQVGAEI